MRTEVVAGYDKDSKEEYSHEYPFVLIRVVAEPTSGDESRVASYVEVGDMSNREARLFVERSPPGMEWLEKVFQLIRETGSRGIVSGGLHEVKIDCEDKIEILEDRSALADHESGKIYFDDGNCGNSKDLDEWID